MAGTEIASLFAALGLKVDEKAWSKGDSILQKMQSSLEYIETASQKVGTVIKGALGLKVVQSLKDVVSEVVELGGHFNDASQKTGVAADTLQEWTYIAGLAGAGGDEFIDALGKLNKGLGEVAQTGKGPVADAFHSLGLSLHDPAIKAGNLDEVLLNIANKFAEMPDGPKKVKAAMDLFGRSGANLIPTLNQGADGIERLKQEARDLGVVMDNETIGQMDEFGDDLDRVEAGWKGIKSGIAQALVPLLAELMPAVIDALKSVVKWVRTHKTEIQAVFYAIGQVLQFLYEVIKLVIQLLIEFGKMVVEIVKFIIDGFVAIGRFLARVATRIVQAFLTAWNWIADKARSLWNGLVSIGQRIVDAFIAVGQGIKDAFTAAFDFVIEKAKAVGRTLRQLPVIKQLGDLGEKIGGALAPSVSEYDVAKNVWNMDHPNQPFPVSEDEFNSKGMKAGDFQTPATPAPTAPTAPAPTYSPTSSVTPAPAGPQVSMTNTFIVNPAAGQDETAIAQTAQRLFDESLAKVGRQLTDGGRLG